MLAIEIDGDIHKYQKYYDNYRDDFIASIGITTLRFSGKDVLKDIDNVIDQIGYILKQQFQVPPGDLGGDPNSPERV